MGLWTYGLMDLWTYGPMDLWTHGPMDYFGELGYWEMWNVKGNSSGGGFVVQVFLSLPTPLPIFLAKLAFNSKN